MSAPKRGLGRGLGALLGDAPVPVSPAGDVLREIPIDQITPNPFQPRQVFDEAALAELRDSIAEYGVLVPIIVRKKEAGGYELIAGERRWRACAALQKATMPALVRSSDDRDSLEVAIIENLQRENLNPLEEAAGFAYLMDEYDFTQEEVARRLGKSRPVVANTLRLLALPDAVKAMLADGRLSARHGRALLSAPESERIALAERAVNEGLSVQALELATGAVKTPRAEKTAPKLRALSPEEHEFESRLRERFATHVAIVRSGRGGRIELGFGNDDELMRIGDLLLGEDRR